MSLSNIEGPADQQGYQHKLLTVYSERRAKNPSYSLRAFARSLGVSKTALSDALSFKRNLSKKNIIKAAQGMGLSPSETQDLISKRTRPIKSALTQEESKLLDEDCFYLISDWYHYGILSLARYKDNQADADWIAQKLGISALEVRAALLRLQRLQMLQIENGSLKRQVAKLNTSDDVVSPALRKHHKQNFKRAETALEEVAPEKREFGSVTFLGDPKRLAKAKKMIRDFQDRLCAYLEAGEGTQVYSLCMQLFPTSQPLNPEMPPNERNLEV